MNPPSTIAEVGIILGHMQDQLARLIALGERSATREEVRAADDVLSRRMDGLESEQRAAQTRLRALEDAKTATDSLVSTLKVIIGLGGSGLLAVVAKYLMSSGN